MNIQLVEEDIKVKLPESFHLTDFGNAIATKGCIVEKEIYEKWLPEPKPQQALNWIVQEVLDETNADTEDLAKNAESPENGTLSNRSIKVREYTMTAMPQETGEQIDISNVIYPIVDDPHTMGRIACTVLVNKLFVMRLFSCSRAVFMLAVCGKWSQSEQDIVEKAAFNGFKQKAEEAQIRVDESEVHIDTICMIGGMLTTNRPWERIEFPNVSVIGDVIVLTKPLGVQIALDAYKIIQRDQNDVKDRLCRIIPEEDLKKAYDGAISLLTTFNLQAIRLTEGHEVHAATEINGHSMMEHAQMLAEQQTNEVAFYIYNLPLIAKMLHVAKVLGYQTDLIQGNVPEISGGLMLVMPREQAASYCRHVLNEGSRAWIIGVVEKGQRTANMIKKARVIDWNWKNESTLS